MNQPSVTRSDAAAGIRPPAVAGLFYAGSAEVLRHDIAGYLAGVRETGPAPKAIIVPHAGLMYSGPVAAAAYGRLRDGAAAIRRVVLIGPAHRVALHGLAVPAVAGLATPLGVVAVDTEARALLRDDPLVSVSDPAHALEHSLEVQLPFLQVVLPGARVLPLVAGDAAPHEVGRVLARVWGGDETLIVVSTDLSHFHDYATARRLDTKSSRRILALDAGLDGEEACGCVGLNGFLTEARRRGLVARLLELRNSADTGGDRSRVVGYGAFSFHEPC